MKIIKIGTFNKEGFPINWEIDAHDMPDIKYILGLDNFGKYSVDVNGVEIVEWSMERMKIMEGK